MIKLSGFSWSRVFAIFQKEVVQMRRDRLTFAIMVMIPVVQLTLFGYAINTDPRHLPTLVEQRDDGPLTRSVLAGLKESTYFDVRSVVRDPKAAEAALKDGTASFVITIPERFEERLVRGERPQILLSADATDPVAVGGPVSAAERIVAQALAANLQGPLAQLAPTPAPVEVVPHRLYNPAGVTAFNIVPGLLGVILTMTMVMITSIALTRESERGTMESLLATPVRPGEIMIGKTTPYILVGAVQTVLVLGAASLLFQVPFSGSPLALVAGLAAFIFVNLMLGYLISTVARTQMQAMQMTFFIFLPSILLSGFMFPFRAMPQWAQMIGEALPLTHFLRIVRGVVLKEGDLASIAYDMRALGIIFVVLTTLALMRFRRTLD